MELIVENEVLEKKEFEKKRHAKDVTWRMTTRRKCEERRKKMDDKMKEKSTGNF
jgi:hypothetical protein